MIFPLLQDEKNRLQSLSRQKEVVFALKKLFINSAMKGTLPTDTATLAAERIALDIIHDAFHQLELVKPDNKLEQKKENIV